MTVYIVYSEKPEVEAKIEGTPLVIQGVLSESNLADLLVLALKENGVEAFIESKMVDDSYALNHINFYLKQQKVKQLEQADGRNES